MLKLKKKKKTIQKRRRRDSIIRLPFRIVALGDLARKFYCADCPMYKLTRYGATKIGWYRDVSGIWRWNYGKSRLNFYAHKKAVKLIANKFYIEKAF